MILFNFFVYPNVLCLLVLYHLSYMKVMHCVLLTVKNFNFCS